MTKKKPSTLKAVKDQYQKMLKARLESIDPNSLIEAEVRRLTIETFNAMLGVEYSFGRTSFISEHNMNSAQKSLNQLIRDAMQPILLGFLADVQIAMPPTTMQKMKKDYKQAYEQNFKYKLEDALRKRAYEDAEKAVGLMMEQLSLPELLDCTDEGK